ncbi:hypothetical protein CEXT_389841 [Caerostris extrusa]|uniref:Uncharacterized protein n=1 Tax=Caerostris extrusa TaxID=172846 RepID=A0AAV4V975_CAEEX|nr:hypothetical protein CEXT_389841 [Caerostris extrusa]
MAAALPPLNCHYNETRLIEEKGWTDLALSGVRHLFRVEGVGAIHHCLPPSPVTLNSCILFHSASVGVRKFSANTCICKRGSVWWGGGRRNDVMRICRKSEKIFW